MPAPSTDVSLEQRDQGPRVLFCAFAEVPGTTSTGARLAQILGGIDKGLALDALSLKGDDLSHIERLGVARMMRVPVAGKPFLEKLAVYQRALHRQISADAYRLVWCGDLFSAAVAAELKAKKGYSLFVEAPELPSSSFARRWPVDPDDEALQKKWRDAERAALKAATRVIAPSRMAAKTQAERVDPRAVLHVGRCVDPSSVTVPSIQVDMDPRETVVVFGGREGGRRAGAVVEILVALARALPADTTRIVALGRSGSTDGDLHAGLHAAEIERRVDLVDVAAPGALGAALASARVVVVPSSAEEGIEPSAIPHRALEAMAAGKAVVVTGPETCFKDAIAHDEHAVVVPARDPAAVRDAVVALLGDPRRRDAIARCGRARVEQSFDLRGRLGEIATLIGDHLGVVVTLRATDGAPAASPTLRHAVAAPPAFPSSEPGRRTGIAPALSSQATDEELRPAAMPTPMPPPDASSVGGYAPASGRLPAAPGEPQPTIVTQRPDLGAGDDDDGADAWHSTRLDEGESSMSVGMPDPLSGPDATHIAARMLVTDDPPSLPRADGASHDDEPDFASVPSRRTLRDPSQPGGESERTVAGAPPGLTSLRVALGGGASDEVASAKSQPGAGDPWAPDTIADGSPIADGTSSSDSAEMVASADVRSASASGPQAQAPQREKTRNLLVEPEPFADLDDPADPTSKIERAPAGKRSDSL